MFPTPARAQQQPSQQPLIVPADVPLHIRLTRTAAMRVGAPVQGVLTAPVWVYDRLALPQGAPIQGHVTALEPVPHDEHLKALLNGDVTRLREAVVDFDSVHLGTADLALSSEARMRQAQTVRFVAQPKTSLFAKLTGLAKQRIQTAREQAFAPGKKDRALRLLFNQLPWHPQRVWRDSDYIADLTAPVQVEVPQKPPHPLAEAALLNSLPPEALVNGRLTTALDSDTAQHGDIVSAIVTRPVFDADQRLVLPEGAQLEGSVQRASHSRSFGRNGALLFTFRTVQRPGEEGRRVRGTLAGAEGSTSQNLGVDAEGNVKAQPAKNRFAAPLLLAITAAAGHDDDAGAGQRVVGANGLGLVARIATLASNNSNVASGFGAYGFAKSIYFRFLARGHAVTFPRDTAVEIQLSGR